MSDTGNGHKWRTTNVIEMIASTYGPYAFGIVVLLVVWLGIVKPELNARALNFEKQELILEQMREIVATQRAMTDELLLQSRSARTTAEILERTVTKLSQMTDDR